MSHLFFPRCRIAARIQWNRTYSGMATTVKEALSNGKLYTDQQQYTFLRFPVSANGHALSLMASSTSSSTSDLFRGIIFDKDEITMMIPSSDYHVFKNSTEQEAAFLKDDHDDVEVGSTPYRLITFDIVLDPNLIGFMHAVTKVLAEENISVLPFAAYSRDHIFVQEKDFNKARAALERLRDDSTSTV